MFSVFKISIRVIFAPKIVTNRFLMFNCCFYFKFLQNKHSQRLTGKIRCHFRQNYSFFIPKNRTWNIFTLYLLPQTLDNYIFAIIIVQTIVYRYYDSSCLSCFGLIKLNLIIKKFDVYLIRAWVENLKNWSINCFCLLYFLEGSYWKYDRRKLTGGLILLKGF